MGGKAQELTIASAHQNIYLSSGSWYLASRLDREKKQGTVEIDHQNPQMDAKQCTVGDLTQDSQGKPDAPQERQTALK